MFYLKNRLDEGGRRGGRGGWAGGGGRGSRGWAGGGRGGGRAGGLGVACALILCAGCGLEAHLLRK